MFIVERVLNMRIAESRLRRIIRSVIAESLDGTRWRGSESGSDITLLEVLEYFKVNNIIPEKFDTQALFYKLSGGKEVLRIIEKGGEESKRRVEAASLVYPVIVVMRNRDVDYILDGNHRLQKAYDLSKNNKEYEKIEVSVLDLDDPRIPEKFVRIF
jgi:hypothetical protein